MIFSYVCFCLYPLYIHAIRPCSEIIVAESDKNMQLRQASRQGRATLAEAIAKHLVYQPGRQEIGASLAFHRAEFDHVHADDGSAVANLAEKVEQLVPVQTAGFRCSYSGHFTWIERIQVNSNVRMFAQTLPGNDGSSLCHLVGPDDSHIWLCFHQLGLFGTETADPEFHQRYAHIYNPALNGGVRERRSFICVA